MMQLIPLRDGRPLLNNNDDNPSRSTTTTTSAVISISNRGYTVLGRVELLSCLYAACGCDPKQQIFSSKRKCKECRSVNKWAMKSLSRRLLKINPKKGNTLSIRGHHALVVVLSSSSSSASMSTSSSPGCYGEAARKDEAQPSTRASCCLDDDDDYILGKYTCDDEDDYYDILQNITTNNSNNENDWRWNFVLNNGMRISLRELEGNGRLDFLVLRPSDTATTSSSSPARIQEEKENEHQCDDEDFIDSNSNVAIRNQLKDKITLNDSIGCDGRERGKATKKGICIFFCSIGQDMSRQRLQLLSKEAVARGATVVSNYKEATHIIISTLIKSLEIVAEYLGENTENLEEYLRLSNVQCVAPHWLTKTTISSSSSSTVAVQQNAKLVERVHFSFLWTGTYAPNKKRRGVDSGLMGTKRRRQAKKIPRNKEISDVFLRLSKLYQNAPLWPEDIWKAYKFNQLAGRLQHLELDYRVDPSTFMSYIKKVEGFEGRSVIRLIREFITNDGHIKRIDNLQNDPTRIALQNLMAIWGVGRATALDWVQDGYKNIDEVRDGIRAKRLVVTRNQRVGIDCYEDLLEKMDRDEVKSIGDIVIQAIKSMPAYSSTVEATIMGSYRRGKQSSGDVDVLITFSDYYNCVPNGALQALVDDLFDKGHIANHLTILPGMTTGGPCGRKNSRKSKSSKEAMSYMGVFYSSKDHRKRRRVDIKMYPLKQKAFATLYFTGSAYFNRSMRLHSTKQFGYKLSDRGLINASGKSVMERDGGSISEQDIFQKLQLVYKEPKNRVFFDDVIPL